ncbi:tail protein X [Wolbachia endosymbiont of Pentalonia nigronervosa]|uniref:tail protein X n=1 Tax=Wolbachia endosymbiont of Pentalonia nigronervosa TaxID=1301914 RepID=UPI00165FF35E|nr:tail protein X [Wolbachia endosymbiont of Pentalonia nigronervosa]MBD0392035.1 tail protein X [Wolbachia endosymbiont of Pentalonia nigronervosa]
MTTYYWTKEGEMIDLICWRHYGATGGVVEVVLEANPGLAEYSGSLPSGLKIKLPIIKEPLKKSVLKVWE